MLTLTTNCSGPVRETDGAGYFCPLNPTFEPETDWDEHCALCQARREHWEELSGDCAREGVV